jgi:hypothetical protein
MRLEDIALDDGAPGAGGGTGTWRDAGARFGARACGGAGAWLAARSAPLADDRSVTGTCWALASESPAIPAACSATSLSTPY